MTHRWRKFVFRTGTVLVFATAVLGPVSTAFADPVNPTPSTDGMPGAALWNQVLGWMMQWGLWLSLAAIVLGAGGWWVSASTGSYGGDGDEPIDEIRHERREAERDDSDHERAELGETVLNDTIARSAGSSNAA